jgi:hypothetical protein
MRKQVALLIVLLLVLVVACGGNSNQNTNSSGSSEVGGGTSSQNSNLPKQSYPKRGWLCDYDRTGEIRLWITPTMDATVKDIVGTCTACCVDVIMLEETVVDGIIFYRISVGNQSGWVDVDYFYWTKPGWAAN